jgi:hypothetical protein
MTTNGYFYDAIEREVEHDFLPLITANVTSNLEKQAQAYKIVDGIIILLTVDIIRDAVVFWRSQPVEVIQVEEQVKPQEPSNATEAEQPSPTDAPTQETAANPTN